MLEEELASGKLEIVSDQFLPTRTSYFLVVPETRASLPAVKQFTNWLIGQARAAGDAKPADRRAKRQRGDAVRSR
jgi:DNA-binding transcriptional LysR family regulator